MIVFLGWLIVLATRNWLVSLPVTVQKDVHGESQQQVTLTHEELEASGGLQRCMAVRGESFSVTREDAGMCHKRRRGNEEKRSSRLVFERWGMMR